jgi:hypothetical protein
MGMDYLLTGTLALQPRWTEVIQPQVALAGIDVSQWETMTCPHASLASMSQQPS